MKIVYVSDAIYPYNKGGKEKRLYELSTRLASRGHDVHIYTMHWWDSPSEVVVEDGVTLHAISKLYGMYDGDRRSIKEGLLFGLACLKLMRVRFDILDIDHMPYFPIMSAGIVCTLKRRRFYGTWHEALSRKDWTDYMGVSGNIAALIESICVKLPYSITAASSQTKLLLRDIHHRGSRVNLVASGVDLKAIQAIKPKAAFDILYVGRLVKDKNIDKLIEAVAILREDKPDVRCVVIGHGVEKPALKRLVSKLKLEKNVSMLDPLPDAKDVYAYMKGAKVFVLPSVREGFGIVALEALACNTPVVTVDSAANAAKDLIMNQQMGSIVSLDSKDIASAIKPRIEKATKQTIAQFVSEFDWDRLAAMQVRAYET